MRKYDFEYPRIGDTDPFGGLTLQQLADMEAALEKDSHGIDFVTDWAGWMCGDCIDHQAVWKAVDRLGQLGAIISEVSWPMYRYCAAIASAIQMAEATAYHSQLIRNHGPRIYRPVRLRLEAGFFITAIDYVQAERARGLFYRESLKLFKEVDLRGRPHRSGHRIQDRSTRVNVGDKTAGVIGLLTQYTRPFNLNGFPAISVPCGFSNEGLPIGLQLAGRPLEDETVLRACGRRWSAKAGSG